MRTLTILIAAGLALPLCGQTTRTISRADLRDKIEGGWAGQMIGVSYGAPTEFRFSGQIIPADRLPQWKPEMVSNSLDQDDLYVDMTFAKVLDDKGIDATTEDFGAMFKDAKYRLWHANLAARRALKRGVPATLSGHAEVQRARQRHRFPDRSRLHRPDGARACRRARTRLRCAPGG